MGKELKKVTRIGVYGVVIDQEKMLVVRQERGPYAGKLDFPGGGIEGIESAELALRREFAEEVGMKFDFMQLIDTLTATIEVQKDLSHGCYLFHQIGRIYKVHGCQLIKASKQKELQYAWIAPESLLRENCSLLLWKFLKKNFSIPQE